MAETIILNVTGMSCEGCANAVKKIVARTHPEAQTQVDLAKARVQVTGVADGAALAEAISKGGYPATVIG